MADSVTTQQADMKKLLAKANAIIANIRLNWAEREAHEKALAEANSQLKRAKREAHEKLLAEANALIAKSQLKRTEREANAIKRAEREAKHADTPSAEPFLTTAQWLSVISIAASLAGF